MQAREAGIGDLGIEGGDLAAIGAGQDVLDA